MLYTLLIVLLVLACIGGLPHFPYSQHWGYGPSSLAGILLLIVVILFVFGR